MDNVERGFSYKAGENDENGWKFSDFLYFHAFVIPLPSSNKGKLQSLYYNNILNNLS